MPKRITFEGQTHVFPDDFTDDEISAALESAPPTPTAQQLQNRQDISAQGDENAREVNSKRTLRQSTLQGAEYMREGASNLGLPDFAAELPINIAEAGLGAVAKFPAVIGSMAAQGALVPPAAAAAVDAVQRPAAPVEGAGLIEVRPDPERGITPDIAAQLEEQANESKGISPELAIWLKNPKLGIASGAVSGMQDASEVVNEFISDTHFGQGEGYETARDVGMAAPLVAGLAAAPVALGAAILGAPVVKRGAEFVSKHALEPSLEGTGIDPEYFTEALSGGAELASFPGIMKGAKGAQKRVAGIAEKYITASKGTADVALEATDLTTRKGRNAEQKRLRQERDSFGEELLDPSVEAEIAKKIPPLPAAQKIAASIAGRVSGHIIGGMTGDPLFVGWLLANEGRRLALSKATKRWTKKKSAEMRKQYREETGREVQIDPTMTTTETAVAAPVDPLRPNTITQGTAADTMSAVGSSIQESEIAGLMSRNRGITREMAVELLERERAKAATSSEVPGVLDTERTVIDNIPPVEAPPVAPTEAPPVKAAPKKPVKKMPAGRGAGKAKDLADAETKLTAAKRKLAAAKKDNDGPVIAKAENLIEKRKVEVKEFKQDAAKQKSLDERIAKAKEESKKSKVEPAKNQAEVDAAAEAELAALEGKKKTPAKKPVRDKPVSAKRGQPTIPDKAEVVYEVKPTKDGKRVVVYRDGKKTQSFDKVKGPKGAEEYIERQKLNDAGGSVSKPSEGPRIAQEKPKPTKRNKEGHEVPPEADTVPVKAEGAKRASLPVRPQETQLTRTETGSKGVPEYAYDEAGRVLELVNARDGQVYRYYGVEKNVVDAALAAESKGKAFNQLVAEHRKAGGKSTREPDFVETKPEPTKPTPTTPKPKKAAPKKPEAKKPTKSKEDLIAKREADLKAAAEKDAATKTKGAEDAKRLSGPARTAKATKGHTIEDGKVVSRKAESPGLNGKAGDAITETKSRFEADKVETARRAKAETERLKKIADKKESVEKKAEAKKKAAAKPAKQKVSTKAKEEPVTKSPKSTGADSEFTITELPNGRFSVRTAKSGMQVDTFKTAAEAAAKVREMRGVVVEGAQFDIPKPLVAKPLVALKNKLTVADIESLNPGFKGKVKVHAIDGLTFKYKEGRVIFRNNGDIKFTLESGAAHGIKSQADLGSRFVHGKTSYTLKRSALIEIREKSSLPHEFYHFMEKLFLTGKEIVTARKASVKRAKANKIDPSEQVANDFRTFKNATDARRAKLSKTPQGRVFQKIIDFTEAVLDKVYTTQKGVFRQAMKAETLKRVGEGAKGKGRSALHGLQGKAGKAVKASSAQLSVKGRGKGLETKDGYVIEPTLDEAPGYNVGKRKKSGDIEWFDRGETLSEAKNWVDAARKQEQLNVPAGLQGKAGKAITKKK